MAHLFKRQFDTASVWAETARRDFPGFLLAAAVLAASHAQAGRALEARRAMAQVRELDPGLHLSAVADWLPIRRAEHLSVLLEGLERAGLPQ